MKLLSVLAGLLVTVACAPLWPAKPETAPRFLERQQPPGGMPARENGCRPSAETNPAIRSEDSLLRSLIAGSCEQSPTLQRLADAIARTDGVVYVSPGLCRMRALRGCLLHSILDTGNARYLWIRVAAHGDGREMMATMAHELQHALEVLSHTNIRNRRDLLDFYQSLESQSYATHASPHRIYETHAALSIGTRVRAELSAASVAAAADDAR